MTTLQAAFDEAQAAAPRGWHVEGQVLPLWHSGYIAAATDYHGQVAIAPGYTPILALANLRRNIALGPVFPDWRTFLQCNMVQLGAAVAAEQPTSD